MSKIVFFCIPAHGHTNPTLGVVKELVSQGHEIWYYSYNIMREKIEEAGAKFVACDDFDAEMQLSSKEAAKLGSDLVLSTKVLVDTTLALDDAVCEHMRQLQPDCIVADSMAVWGKAVAMKLGIPFVSSTTTFAFNRHSAKIMKQNLRDLFFMIVSMPKVQKDIRRLQKKGYPVKNILDIIQNDDNTHTIVYTSAEFQPCSDTFSDKYAFVGPSIREIKSLIDKTRSKRIYMSMGTVNNNMLSLYKSVISVFGNTSHQVILSVGNQVDVREFGMLPDNVCVYSTVDQIGVLSQTDVFISHCGMNSVSESLYFGVPIVMLPQTAEQKGVAFRTAQLGAGILADKMDAKSIASAVETILADQSYAENAAKIGYGFRECSGAKGAANKIISVCKKKTGR